MKKPDPTPSASTILVISMGFLFLHLIFDWPWALYTSFCVGAAGILSSRLGNLIAAAWMGLAAVLGSIVPRIVLTLIFFCLLTPLAAVYRLRSGDPLRLKDHYETLFEDPVSKTVDRGLFEKIW